MVKSNSEIIEGILSDQLIEYQEGVCGIGRRTRDARAYDSRPCGVKNGLRGTKGTGNGESCHRTPNLLNKSHEYCTFFQGQDLKTRLMGQYEEHFKPLKRQWSE